MEISITAVTKNRNFTKALVRVAQYIQPFKVSSEEIDTANEKLDILQLVFVDQDDDHVSADKIKKGSRLQQIEIGIPTGLLYKPEEDHELGDAIKHRVCKAIQASFLLNITKAAAISKLESL